VGKQTLKIFISFAMVGFSYFNNANIAAGIWFFHILSKFEKEFFTLSGLVSEQKILYGVADFPLLAYQGVGALLAMVLAGLWVGREHYTNVWRKALGRAPEVDDSDEVLSYRSAFFGLVGGIVTMSFWLWLMGTPLWVAVLFVCLALLIFIGITRIVAEAGLATVRAPMIAPDLLVLGLGADVVGGAAVWNLSLAYMWTADVRVFVLANCTNALKLIEEMPLRLRRMVFWAMVLALLIGALGSFWMIFHMAYLHGGINLNAWFFKGAPRAAYGSALRAMDPASLYWPGWGFFTGGGLLMLLMMWARQRVPWWPVHPIGFPIGANGLMQHVWFSVFLAWLLKKLILRYGGATLYRRSQHFFLGLICGQALCNGIWLVIDYFTGRVGNSIFWI
jgi:ABC-type amino acid transport system permease subunit